MKSLYLIPSLSAGIITHQAGGGTVQVFKGRGDIGLSGHEITSKEVGGNTTIELEHSSTTMARDTIIMGRDSTEDGISGVPLREVPDIGSREARFEVLVEGMMNGGMVELSCSIQGGLDAVNRHPGKVGAKQIKVRKAGARAAGGKQPSKRQIQGTLRGQCVSMHGQQS